MLLPVYKPYVSARILYKYAFVLFLMDDYLKSGEICKNAREYGASLLKEGAKFLDIAEKIEAKIKELGGEPAFPVDIGINHLAAHDSPRYTDERILAKGDLVKLDLGVHVDGAVTDTAISVEISSSEYKKLIDSAEEALKAALEIAKPGVEIREVGRVIKDKINSYGFIPIINLTGHRVDKYEVHAAPSIPNFDNGDSTKLLEGQVFAIEPFATDGSGRVVEGKPSGIYGLINPRNVRDNNARKILSYIMEKYQTLPFSERWLIKEFGQKVRFSLLSLEREGVIKQYNILPEKERGQVAQAERTIIVGKGVIN